MTITNTEKPGLVAIAEAIVNELGKGKFALDVSIRQGGVVVLKGSGHGGALDYTISPKGVYAPNPENHAQHNGFNAVVHNVDETLLIMGLDCTIVSPERVLYK